MVDEARAEQASDLADELSRFIDDLEDFKYKLTELSDQLGDDEEDRNTGFHEGPNGVEQELYGRISEQGARELWAALTGVTVQEVTYSPSWQEVVSSVAVYAAEAREMGTWRKHLREKDDAIRGLERRLEIALNDRKHMFEQAQHWHSAAKRMSMSIAVAEEWLLDLQRIIDRERQGAVSVFSVKRVSNKLYRWCSAARRAEQELVNNIDEDDESSLPLEYELD